MVGREKNERSERVWRGRGAGVVLSWQGSLGMIDKVSVSVRRGDIRESDKWGLSGREKEGGFRG